MPKLSLRAFERCIRIRCLKADTIPEHDKGEIREFLGGHRVLRLWRDAESERVLMKVLLPAEEAEPIVDLAPLVSPNVALALATTLGDVRLALNALRAIAAGIGAVFGVDPATPTIAERTQVGPGDRLPSWYGSPSS